METVPTTQESMSDQYNEEDWIECGIAYQHEGYWEPVDDGSGRVRFWRQREDGQPGEGSWVIDYPPGHPRKIARAKSRMPFFCPVCGDGMRSYKEDASSYRMHRCCHKCVIDFVEGSEKEWMGGWRPTKEEKDYWMGKRPNKL